MKRLTLLFFFCSLSLQVALAQSYIGAGAEIGVFARSGQWSKLYGLGSEAGTRMEIGLGNGIYLAPKASIFFGTKVKQDPLAALRDPSGRIIGDVSIEGRPTSLALRSRGYRFAGLLGYQKSIGKSGLGVRAAIGPTYTVHYIRIQDDATITTSNLRDAYKRGYDRRAGGFGGTLEAGVSYLNLNGSLRVFLVGTLDVMTSKALNSTQFDLGTASPADGTDVGVGGRFGFILGLKRTARGSSEDIYY